MWHNYYGADTLSVTSGTKNDCQLKVNKSNPDSLFINYLE